MKPVLCMGICVYRSTSHCPFVSGHMSPIVDAFSAFYALGGAPFSNYYDLQPRMHALTREDEA